ncbi:GDP dissociation inhibitor like protein [Babesia gibsoni]|uniref:GDP dissociation inhibitor like protein n=1 Tax=Babesia gibsoni TaxID=33632 RepID=A0AAD8PGR3_BABGI|nr:GDP dissociation inhibitor like protein [Babesia gibsoni]
MDDEISVDAVIAGTGITASLIAANLSYNGCKVLQIDRHRYYGSSHRTLTVKYLLQMRESRCLNSVDRLRGQWMTYVSQQGVSKVSEGHSQRETCDVNMSRDDGESPNSTHEAEVHARTASVDREKFDEFLTLLSSHKTDDAKVYFELSPFAKGGVEEVMALEHLFDEKSKYAFDLWPKVLFSKSATVDFLLNSGAHSYIHFTDTKGPMIYGYEPQDEDEKFILYRIPNSKTAISRSGLMSPMEKRTLMLFISSLSDIIYVPMFSSLSLRGGDAPEDSVGASAMSVIENPNENWTAFLKRTGCTQTLIDLLSYGICLGGGDIATWTKLQGLERMLKYVQSVGVFGEHDSSFVYSMYGTADIVQAFCRVGALLGATYMLDTSVEAVTHDEDSGVKILTLSNQIKVKTKLLIVDDEMVIPKELRPRDERTSGAAFNSRRYLHVMTFVYPKPVIPEVNIAVICPKEESTKGNPEGEPIYLFQTGSDTGTAPDNMHVVYVMTIDSHQPLPFESFSQCNHPSVNRLQRCFKSVLGLNGNGLDEVTLVIYTSHELDDGADYRKHSIAEHAGWLSKDGSQRKGSGVVFITMLNGTPVIPLIEEIPMAVTICDTLLSGRERQLSPYMDSGLEEFLHVERKEPAEDMEEDSTAEKLDSIINKYA